MDMITMSSNLEWITLHTFTYSAQVFEKRCFNNLMDERLVVFGAVG
jgi:hypothetical protein